MSSLTFFIYCDRATKWIAYVPIAVKKRFNVQTLIWDFNKES